MSKFSSHMQTLLESVPLETPVDLNLVLGQATPEDRVEHVLQLVREIVTQAESVEFMPRQQMVLCTTALATVNQLALIDEVIWIDLDHKAPTVALLNTDVFT